MADPVTLTDRIAEVAPYGFRRVFGHAGYTPWRRTTKAWVEKNSNGGPHLIYLTPAQAADALENCEECGGVGRVAFPERPTDEETDWRPCPSCASLRACVEELL